MSSIILIKTNIQQPKRKFVVRNYLFLKIAWRQAKQAAVGWRGFQSKEQRYNSIHNEAERLENENIMILSLHLLPFQ